MAIEQQAYSTIQITESLSSGPDNGSLAHPAEPTLTTFFDLSIPVEPTDGEPTNGTLLKALVQEHPRMALKDMAELLDLPPHVVRGCYRSARRLFPALPEAEKKSPVPAFVLGTIASFLVFRNNEKNPAVLRFVPAEFRPQLANIEQDYATIHSLTAELGEAGVITGWNLVMRAIKLAFPGNVLDINGRPVPINDLLPRRRISGRTTNMSYLYPNGVLRPIRDVKLSIGEQRRSGEAILPHLDEMTEAMRQTVVAYYERMEQWINNQTQAFNAQERSSTSRSVLADFNEIAVSEAERIIADNPPGLLNDCDFTILLEAITPWRSRKQPRLKEEEVGYPEQQRLSAILNYLVEKNMGLVFHVVNRYTGYGIPKYDLVSAGRHGLVRSISRFDPARKRRLSSYAIPSIEKHIRRYISKNQPEALALPEHTNKARRLTQQTALQLTQELGRQPTVDEIAAACGVQPAMVTALSRARRLQSLEALIRSYSGHQRLWNEIIDDPNLGEPEDAAISNISFGDWLENSGLTETEKLVIETVVIGGATLDEAALALAQIGITTKGRPLLTQSMSVHVKRGLNKIASRIDELALELISNGSSPQQAALEMADPGIIFGGKPLAPQVITQMAQRALNKTKTGGETERTKRIKLLGEQLTRSSDLTPIHQWVLYLDQVWRLRFDQIGRWLAEYGLVEVPLAPAEVNRYKQEALQKITESNHH